MGKWKCTTCGMELDCVTPPWNQPCHGIPGQTVHDNSGYHLPTHNWVPNDDGRW